MNAACAAAALLAATIAGTAAALPATNADPIEEGLRALHQGLFTQAEEIFRGAGGSLPDDPEPMLFVAFSRWWRIVLEDRTRGAADERFDAALDATLDAGERRLEAAPDDARVRALVGTAHILRSHVEALRRSYFHAAQEARRGKRLLESALEEDPRLTDARFALGALNYYADRVPAIVKGIRALLFLPGGDAARGLDQLRSVAASDGRFRTDARLLLALICSGREEGCYRAALAQLEEGLRENPGSPLILGSLAEIRARLGFYDEAARDYERALAGAQGDGPDRARQRRTLRLALAETLLADWKIDAAERLIRDADADPGPPESALERARARVGRDLVLRRGEIPRAALRSQEEGDLEAALAALGGSPTSRDGDPLAEFLRGRILFLLNRPDEAKKALEEASAMTPAPPAWMSGWSELYLGMIAARRGETRAGRAHFRRASEVRGFRSADRGMLELAPDGDPRSHCPPAGSPEGGAGSGL